MRLILNKYVVALRQIINMEKSTMVFCPNIQPAVSTAIQNIMPFLVVPKFGPPSKNMTIEGGGFQLGEG